MGSGFSTADSSRAALDVESYSNLRDNLELRVVDVSGAESYGQFQWCHFNTTTLAVLSCTRREVIDNVV